MKALLAAPLLLLLLAGCTPTVALTPAPDATSVGCAGVVARARLLTTIGGAGLRATDAQGTLAWGQPATVFLTCGVASPAVSSVDCGEVDGVDWLTEDRTIGGTPSAVYTTYDRDPALQIIVQQGDASRSDVLQALSDPIAAATGSNGRKCIAVSDVPTP